MKRFILTMSQKSAKGVVDQAVGKVSEALQCRKAEQPIDRAGNDDRRPERYPARGIKGTANKQCDLRDDTRQKANIVWPSRRQVRVKPRGASRQGPNRLLATHYAERLAFHTQLNPPNRRMRTRMYGGVGGEDRRLSPLSRLRWASADR